MGYVAGNQFTLEEFNALTEADYEVGKAAPSKPSTLPYLSISHYTEAKPVYDKYKSVYDYFGITLTRNDGYGIADYAFWQVNGNPQGGGVQLYAAGLGIPWSDRLRFTPTPAINTTLQGYRDSILSSWKVNPPHRESGTFVDTILSSPFAPQNFLNVITGSKSLEKIFSSDSIGTDLFQSVLHPEPQNYTNIGIKAGVDVVSNIGLAYGVETSSIALTNYQAASGALASGTAGPVAPGFFETLFAGNFSGAYQILANPYIAASASVNAPLVAQFGIGEAIRQVVGEIVKLTGDVGRGIANLFSGNVVGALQDFNVVNTGANNLPQPPNLYGSYGGSGGGGGGSGLGIVGQKAGQSSSGSLWYPVIGLSVIVLVFLYMRKK